MKFCPKGTFHIPVRASIMGCLVLLVLSATPLFSAPMMATMLPNGHLATQSVLGGSTRKSTNIEITSWKAQPNLLAITSPDGRYKVSQVKLEDQSTNAFQVLRVHDERLILSAKVLAASIDDGNNIDGLYFNGWLPNSRQMVISANSHISSDDFARFGIIDIPSGRLIAFNGFVSPNMRYAIVSGKSGKIEEDFRHYEDEPRHEVRTKGDIRWYVVPLLHNISNYHFSSTQAKPILLEHKPFPFFYEVIRGMSEDDPSRQYKSIDFSPDGQWAICHIKDYSTRLQKFVYDVDYLVSMTTGMMRKLPGSQTHFF